MNDNYANIYLFSTQKYAKKYLFYPKIYLLKKILIYWGFAAETLHLLYLNTIMHLGALESVSSVDHVGDIVPVPKYLKGESP